MVSRLPDPRLTVSSSRPRRRDRVPRLVRFALLAGTAACAAITVAPSTVLADVARLEPVSKTKPGERPANHEYRIVVTDQHGAQRTLGPVPSGDLHAAPDGRHLVLVPDNGDDEPVPPRLVPLDGSPVRALRLPAGTAIVGGLSQVSWTPDGTELLVGDALGWDPSAFARPSAIEDIDRFRWTTLRCPIATETCSEIPAASGFAVGIPGGIVTTSSHLTSFPPSWLFDESTVDWERPTSPRGRTWRSIANDVRTTSTQLIGETTVALGRDERTGRSGVPVAVSAIGGPFGAVISRITVVTEVERRRGRIRLNTRNRRPRFLLVRPGAPLRSFASRPITLPRRDHRRVAPGTAAAGQRLHFQPRFVAADRWIGGAGPYLTVPDHAVLATMGGEGQIRPVTVQGRPATAWNLLRVARGRSPGRIAGGIEIIGYEAAGNVIVSVGYRFGGTEMPGLPRRFATLRVPLDGKARPTIIRGKVDAAW